MKLIVGLGNPGKKYENSRHNVGFMAIDDLLKILEIEPSWNSKFKSLHQKKGSWIFLKPQTYMNLSGEAVQKAVNFYKILPENIVVIHDDLDLDEGKIRYRSKGSSGGHNGINSIIQSLGTNQFSRIKIGIGHPGHKSKVKKYVLEKVALDNEMIHNAAIRTKEWLKK